METVLVMYFPVFLIYFVLACMYLSSLYVRESPMPTLCCLFSDHSPLIPTVGNIDPAPPPPPCVLQPVPQPPVPYPSYLHSLIPEFHPFSHFYPVSFRYVPCRQIVGFTSAEAKPCRSHDLRVRTLWELHSCSFYILIMSSAALYINPTPLYGLDLSLLLKGLTLQR